MYKNKKIKIKFYYKNLIKKYIVLNKAIYSLFILFIFKKNKNFRFYIDYRKFNKIIRRNRYALPFIKEIINKIFNYKYFSKFNIIVIFNKIRIYPDNENIITFIIILKSYKYKILLFRFINNFISF